MSRQDLSSFSGCALILTAAVGVSCAAPQSEPVPARALSEPGLGQLVISPPSATLAVGDSIQLRALEVASPGDSNVLGTDVRWHSANVEIATVSERGLVRAVGPGLAGIAARTDDLVGSARVIVSRTASAVQRQAPAVQPGSVPAALPRTGREAVASAGQPARPNAAASGDRQPDGARPATTKTSNEPAGYKPITDRHFHSKHPDYGYGSLPKYPEKSDLPLAEGWSATEGASRNLTILEDPSAPSGDGMVAQMFFPARMKSGTGPGRATLYFPPDIREAYIAVWMKLSPNWVGNQASINKMYFVGVSGGNNQFIFEAYGSGNRKLVPTLALQGVLDNNKRSQLHRPNLAVTEIVRGQWHKIEVILRCNSAPNAPDGSMDLWVDGVHTTSVRSVNFTKKSDQSRPCSINVLNWNPTYGGGGASPGADLFQRFDRVYISGR
jgi:hypothetical protein